MPFPNCLKIRERGHGGGHHRPHRPRGRPKAAEALAQKTYAHRLSEEDLSSILAKRFTGWGRLSGILTRSISSARNPEPLSSSTPWHTNNNLMELLSSASVLRGPRGLPLGIPERTGLYLEAYLQESYARHPSLHQSNHQIIGEIEKIMKDPRQGVRGGGPGGWGKGRRGGSAPERPNCWSCTAVQPECDALMAELDSREEHSLRRDKLLLILCPMRQMHVFRRTDPAGYP